MLFRRKELVLPPMNLVHSLIEAHFKPIPLDKLSLTERRFLHRVRADLQRAVEGLLDGRLKVLGWYGLFKHYNHQEIDFAELLIQGGPDPTQTVPPLYEEIDIGEDRPVRCLKNGLWLLESDGTRLAVLLERYAPFGQVQGMRFQVATPNDPAGAAVAGRFFEHLEEAVKQAGSYRGKVLSLEVKEMYSGESSGITVHRLKPVERDQVILPAQTLELLERNVLRFVGLRPRLNELGLATKKGLLFYGPPGTGKTHTIHYLAGALPGHTTLLITAEQVGLLDEYMALARLLQPSIVVIEDVDLIARDRTTMDSPCEEVLLNKLLNEMDGLRADAEILFILTTNRPEALEAALASRPGRVDQAIEFPLPNDEGRTKLMRLYARGMEVPEEVLRATVQRTEGVSASFIKELMRRSAQFHLERDGEEPLALGDVEAALDELLFRGGSLNRKLLGGRVEENGVPCTP
jgi:cell division protease FtsH